VSGNPESVRVAMFCQSCGLEAPTKNVAFYQIKGSLAIYESKSIRGNLCKRCIHKHFRRMTLINFVAGWWGIPSVFLTPCFIFNNVVQYVLCLWMAPPAKADADRTSDFG
jgi:hypothetical protein